MAIIRTSSIVASISGSIGGQTFITGKRGTVARIRAYRSPKKSAALQARQALFKTIIDHWRAYTEQERNSWRDLARTFPRSNRLGQNSPLSGYQLYVRTMLKRAGTQGALNYRLPFLAPSANVTAVTTTCIGTNEPTVFVTTVSPHIVSSVRIYGARNLSTIQPKFIKNWRLVFGTVIDAGGPEEIFWSDRWIDKIGELLTDETYAIRVTAYETINDLTEKPGLIALGQQQD